jgi:FtsP/CotA-like multicopper oxidase with cupredoxin domain
MSDEKRNDSGITRREMLLGTAAMAGGAALLRPRQAEALETPHAGKAPDGKVYTPNGATAEYVETDGVKVFHLRAHEFEREFCEGLTLRCWGWNGLTPGPTIEVNEGDRCRFYVTNDLPEPTTIHWHGVLLPNGMDGVAGLNQPAIPSGETFVYEFPFTKPGTFMYHPHFDEMTQIALGMKGMIVVHPKRQRGPQVDRDYCMMLHEWKVHPGTRRPDPNADSGFNILTINGKAFPGTHPIVARTGERVRIRFGNLSPMEHHPIHLHGHAFEVTQTDGGYVPESARWPETTVLVPVGSARAVEFVADAPGDWAMHCHMTHHIMNQMGHGIPNMVGADLSGVSDDIRELVPGYHSMGTTGMGGMGEMGEKMPQPENTIPMKGGHGPFGYIDMGGMFTIVKVRDDLEGYDDPGWYDHPDGTVARKATAAAMKQDGIDA